MAATKEKTQKFRVKSHIQMGTRNPSQNDPTAPDYTITKEYHPGSSIEVAAMQADEIRHALENPPAPRRAAMVTDEDEDEELDEDEEDALESIRRRPDNPASGVQQHWKVDKLAVAAEANSRRRAAGKGTKETGGGFERANVNDQFSLQGGGLNDPGTATGPRPEANKTEMEIEEEEAIAEAREKEEKEAAKKAAGDKK